MGRPRARVGRAAWLALLFMAGGFGTGKAAEGKPRLLISDLSDWHIGVGSDFTGTDVLVFGAIAPTARRADFGPTANQIVIVLRGEAETNVVRRKERMAGIWVNGKSVRFARVPSIYQVASTEPLEDIAPPELLAQNEIGLGTLSLPAVQPSTEEPPTPDEEVETFRKALLRQRAEAGVYRQHEGTVTLIEGALFRGSLHLPADVPLGRYRVTVYLIRDGRVIAQNILPLRIERAGVEKRISRMSERRPLLYGVIAVLFALSSGWLGNLLFRDR